jgi:CRP-like cAMP-binding protein
VVATVEAEASQDDRRPVDWDARLDLLRSVDLLAALDDAGRQRFALGMRRLDFAAGEVILRQGTEGDALYLVDRGEVGVRIDVDGSTSEIATLGRGNVFGEMALLTGEPRVATCVARTEVSCYAIERGPFEVLLAERPEIAEDFARTLAARRSALEAQRLGLSAAARARLEADERSRLLTRVRDVFGGGTA